MTRYALKFTRKDVPYKFVYDSEELKRARRMLHLLKLFGCKDARLTTMAEHVASYAQPGLLAEEDGGPLFSMA